MSLDALCFIFSVDKILMTMISSVVALRMINSVHMKGGKNKKNELSIFNVVVTSTVVMKVSRI